MEPKESLFCIENFSSGTLEISRKGDSIIFKCIPIKNEDEVYQPKEGDFITVETSTTKMIGICKDFSDKNSMLIHAGIGLDKEFLLNSYFLITLFREVRPSTYEEKESLLFELDIRNLRWNSKENKVEQIPPSLTEEDIVIAWNTLYPDRAIIAKIIETDSLSSPHYRCNDRRWYDTAVKFESMEQYDKIRMGEL